MLESCVVHESLSFIVKLIVDFFVDKQTININLQLNYETQLWIESMIVHMSSALVVLEFKTPIEHLVP